MLIEMAIPEIEAEANKLLARMTDNRMHIKMETQRETKKGDVMETLDINISDELGTRNYEMFSGGEAFPYRFCHPHRFIQAAGPPRRSAFAHVDY